VSEESLEFVELPDLVVLMVRTVLTVKMVSLVWTVAMVPMEKLVPLESPVFQDPRENLVLMVFLVNRELPVSLEPPETFSTEKRENPVYLDRMVFQEPLEPREPKENPVKMVLMDRMAFLESLEIKELRENKDPLDPKDPRESKEPSVNPESLEPPVIPELTEPKVPPGIRDKKEKMELAFLELMVPLVTKVIKDRRENKVFPELLGSKELLESQVK